METKVEMIMTLPRKMWVTRAQVLAADLGLTRYDFDKAVQTGVLHGTVFPGRKQRKFLREEVARVFGVNE